tara:strand:+ start:10955 stop:13204 length:2250 start_codon:yes stop_codon:yes gene_type:complete
MANIDCTQETRDQIEPTCKSYQRFDSELCNCVDKDGHDPVTRKHLQDGFEGCIADENSQECYESLAAGASGLTDDCTDLSEKQGIGGSNSFESSSEIDSSKNIVTTRNSSGDLVPPQNMMCSEFDESGDLSEWNRWINVIKGMYIAISIFMYYGFKNNEKLVMGHCFGTVAFIGANIASLITEIVAWIMSKDKLSSLIDEYEESTKCKVGGEENSDCNPLDPMEAQTKAFDFIIEERNILSEMAHAKFITYLINAVLMALAGLLLIIQASISASTLSSSGASCGTTASLDNDNQDNGIFSIFTDGIKKLITRQLFPNYSFAQEEEKEVKGAWSSCGLSAIPGLNKMDALSQQDETAVRTMPYVGQLICGAAWGSLVASASVGFKIDNALTSFMSGTGGVVTGFVLGAISAALAVFYSIMAKEYHLFSNAAKNQANKVASMKEAILEQIEIICPSGRNDPSDTRCFCFDENGGRRNDRTNSETCQNLFAALDAKITLTSGDLALSQSIQRKCCVALDGNIDCDCNCQKFKNKQTGENACLKAVIPPAQLNSIGGIPGVGDGLNQLASSTGASSASSNVNADSLKKNAKTLLNSGRQILKQVSDKQVKKGGKPILAPSLAPYLRAANELGNKIQTTSLPLSPSSSFSDKVKGNKALAAVKKKLKKKGFQFVGGGRSLRRNKKEKKKDDEFGFAFDNPEGQAQGATETFMDKKYNYKEDDIYKNKSASLWKILSNRYNTSGYLRLFDDEESK